MAGLPRASILVLAIVTTAAVHAQAPPPAWTQWGGPTRDFMVASTGLANSWPATGPRRLWTRALGEGHSSILFENGRLYTQYRPLNSGQEEVVAALDAATGKTIWEYRYPSPTRGADYSEGAGPHATPLIVRNRLFAVGSRREFMAIDKASGKLLWSHDLIKEYRAPDVDRGMANSPLLFNGRVILPIGERGQALGAFNPETGVLIWKGGHANYSPASPVLIDVDGQQQVVQFGGDRIVGLDPGNGTELWNHAHRTDWGLNISTPVWNPVDHLLIFSSAYGTGTAHWSCASRAARPRSASVGPSAESACTSDRSFVSVTLPTCRAAISVRRF